MTDGAASLMSMFYGMSAMGMWKDERGVNLLDSGAHFYDTYETKDGKYIALGSIEPQFYKELLEKTGITDAAFAAQMDRSAWPSLKEKLAAVIKTKTRDEWDTIMLGSDVCYAPVLSIAKRRSIRTMSRARPSSRSTASCSRHRRRASRARCRKCRGRREGADNEAALKAWGFADADVAKLQSAGAI